MHNIYNATVRPSKMILVTSRHYIHTTIQGVESGGDMPSIEGPLVQFVYYVMRVACCFVSTATEIRE